MSKLSPAKMLQGLTLQEWQVGPIMEKVDGQTGGHFSVLYPVTHAKTGRHGFLKAVDLVKDLANPAKLTEKLNNYHYEDRILKLCNDLELEGVVVALASGIHNADFHGNEIAVPYLVFEKADGEARTHVWPVILTATDARHNLRTGSGKPAGALLPSLVFIQEFPAQSGFGLQIAGRRDQLRLGQAIEARFQRRPVRARLITVAEGVPSSPSISICNARNALTVASSICSSRPRISAPASLRPAAR